LTGRKSLSLSRKRRGYGFKADFFRVFQRYYGAQWRAFRRAHRRAWRSHLGLALAPWRSAYADTIWGQLTRRDRAELSRTCAAHVAAVPYQRGDILLIDNLLVEHTAMPWEGERELAVIIGDYTL
jgi:hypothetical protein